MKKKRCSTYPRLSLMPFSPRLRFFFLTSNRTLLCYIQSTCMNILFAYAFMICFTAVRADNSNVYLPTYRCKCAHTNRRTHTNTRRIYKKTRVQKTWLIALKYTYATHICNLNDKYVRNDSNNNKGFNSICLSIGKRKLYYNIKHE